MKSVKLLLSAIILSTILFAQGNLKVKTLHVGAFQTNCYFLYDEITKDAALFDTCMPGDSIVMAVNNLGLNLKYVFLTHCHEDHISGVPELAIEFPETEILFAREEYDCFPKYLNWRKLFNKVQVDEWLAREETATLMDFDYNLIKAETFLVDGKVYKLGTHEIRALKTPGHSPGSYSFVVEDYLFSGDLIIYNSVGYLDYELGSLEEMTKSIQYLYKELPDETKIMPGHGPTSTIGFEKTHNNAVQENEIFWDK